MITQQSGDFEVVITSSDWSSVVRPMSADSSLLSIAELQRSGRSHRNRLIVGEPSVARSGQFGDRFAPLASWIAIGVPGGKPPATPDEWIARLQPRFGQLCVILLVGFGDTGSGWRGWSVERGAVRPLAGFRTVGPNMFTVKRTTTGSMIAGSPPQRWSRTEHAIGEPAYDRLREATVLLVGCSRSGTLSASMLSAIGVRRLILIDGDDIEIHNLDGMILATEADLAANKAISLGRRLVDFRSDLAVTALPRRFGESIREPAVADADLIVTCVDQDGPRWRAAQLARERLIPHLDIGTAVTRNSAGERELTADVRLMFPGAGCVNCVGGLADLEQVEFDLWAPAGSLPRKAPPPWNAEGRLGSLITLNSMAVSTGIQSWLDLLADRLPGSIWHRIRWQVGGSWQVDSGIVGPSEDCHICRMQRE